MFILKRGRTYYYNKRIGCRILRLSLRTSALQIVRKRAAKLFLITNYYRSRNMDYSRIMSLALEEAERMHSELLTDHLSGESSSNMYLYGVWRG